MIIKFNARITIDLKSEKPRNEKEWESFNIQLERLLEQALEASDNNTITTAEVVMEEE